LESGKGGPANPKAELSVGFATSADRSNLWLRIAPGVPQVIGVCLRPLEGRSPNFAFLLFLYAQKYALEQERQ
jgi:hypothetical protein